MASYSHLSESFRKPRTDLSEWQHQIQIRWRREPSITRVVRPTRIDQARKLGYRDKKGVVVVRVRVRRGVARKARPSSGRRQKAMGVLKFTRAISTREIVEGRVRRRFPNLRLVGSYPVGFDGTSHWFEAVLED